jgi:hypothetical protein
MATAMVAPVFPIFLSLAGIGTDTPNNLDDLTCEIDQSHLVIEASHWIRIVVTPQKKQLRIASKIK